MVMRLSCKAIPIILLSCIIVFSCVEEPNKIIEESVEKETYGNVGVMTRSSGDVYTALPNPYALDVMQEVYDIYSETDVTLEATDLYVKFMPKDSLELHRLKYDYNLELFDYPLDIDLADGEVYINPDLPQSDLVWVYTTVEPDFVFPSGISYEILEYCYIPEDGETVGVPTKAGMVNVEDAAFALMGYDNPTPVDTRASVTPQGTITVRDNDIGSDVPVKGVKVRCHRLVKWASAYTDENGLYTMDKSFRYSPYYSIVFENTKDFDIWGNWGPITVAYYNMGKQSNAGYSTNIGTTDKAWLCAAVNNAAYEYYKMCEQTGILKPPTDLKIWIWKNASSSSAPILSKVMDALKARGQSSVENFFYDISVNLINNMLCLVLPDITIGGEDGFGSLKTYGHIYQTVHHELAHSSHFSKVGVSYWVDYISYIISCFGYGDGTKNNAQLCGIGEMWGYYMGYAQAISIYNSSALSSLIDVKYWICPHAFWELDSTQVLSKKQIYDCLTSEVDTYDELVLKMYTLYPDKAVDIENVFSKYPLVKHSVSIPNGNVTCSDRSITSSTTISGDNIFVENVTVSNGATLWLNAGTSITINKPFIIESGSELIMTRGN